MNRVKQLAREANRFRDHPKCNIQQEIREGAAQSFFVNRVKKLAREDNRSRDHPKSDLGQETVEGATKNSGDP